MDQVSKESFRPKNSLAMVFEGKSGPGFHTIAPRCRDLRVTISRLDPKEEMMPIRVSLVILGVVIFISAVPAAAAANDAFQDEGYAGQWAGTYAADGGSTGNVTLTFSKDEGGVWHGSIKYSNQNGDQTAELRELKIAGTKFNAKLTSPDESAVITLEGELKGTRLEGAYSVSENGSTEVAEKGTWKTTRSPAGGKGQ